MINCWVERVKCLISFLLSFLIPPNKHHTVCVCASVCMYVYMLVCVHTDLHACISLCEYICVKCHTHNIIMCVHCFIYKHTSMNIEFTLFIHNKKAKKSLLNTFKCLEHNIYMNKVLQSEYNEKKLPQYCCSQTALK